MKIFIIAGEASGDKLGAAMMKGFEQHISHKLEFIGVGGALMVLLWCVGGALVVRSWCFHGASMVRLLSAGMTPPCLSGHFYSKWHPARQACAHAVATRHADVETFALAARNGGVSLCGASIMICVVFVL